MNKSDLVSAIADHSGLSKADATRALEAVSYTHLTLPTNLRV